MTVQVGTRSPVRVVARERRLGTIVRNAGVVITNVGTGGAATVYSDEDLTTTIASLRTDSNGVFEFYAPPGLYSIAFTGSDAFEAVENVHVVGDDTPPSGTTAALMPDPATTIDNAYPLSIVTATDTHNAANFEQNSGTAVALRLRQAGAGDIMKARSGTSDVAFIRNKGELSLLPLADGRAVTVGSPSWGSSRAFGYGNKDGLFFISGFTDASGVATVNGVQQSYTKLFGGSATKTGPGNMDAFWATITHQGVDEAGLFIGDVTTSAGGNAWGGHFRLTTNTLESNQFGLELELINNVAPTTTVQRALHIRSAGSQPISHGLLMDVGPATVGGYTDYLRILDSSNNDLVRVYGASGPLLGAPTIAGHLHAKRLSADTVSLSPSQPAHVWMNAIAGQNKEVQFQTSGLSRWILRCENSSESGSDAGSNFQLISRTDAGVAKLTFMSCNRQNGTITWGEALNFLFGTTTGTKFGTATTQKMAFWNATPIVQPSGTPAAATDLTTVIALANSLRTNLLSLGLVA